jgi:hypothetical protein
VGPRASLDTVEKRTISGPCRESNPGRPASSPFLYRLSYPGSWSYNMTRRLIKYAEVIKTSFDKYSKTILYKFIRLHRRKRA